MLCLRGISFSPVNSLQTRWRVWRSGLSAICLGWKVISMRRTKIRVVPCSSLRSTPSFRSRVLRAQKMRQRYSICNYIILIFDAFLFTNHALSILFQRLSGRDYTLVILFLPTPGHIPFVICIFSICRYFSVLEMSWFPDFEIRHPLVLIHDIDGMWLQSLFQ